MKHSLISIIVIAFTTTPCMAQWKSDGGNEQAIAYGVHDTSFFASSPGHVERANPNGEADAGISFSQGNVTTFASLGPYFFAGVSNGLIYLSTNNGSNWNVNDSIGSPIATNGYYLYGDDPEGIGLSRDSGKTWQNVSKNSAINFASNGCVIFANTGNAIWISKDTGNTWSKLASPVVGSMTTMGSLLFVVGNGSVAESTDSGAQWNLVPVDSAGVPETVNLLVTDGRNLFAGTMKGVYVSTDIGMTWRVENDGLQPNALWVTAMGIWDTLLYIDITYGTGPFEYAEYYRPIRDMTDTAKSSVQQPLSIPATLAIYPNPLKNSAMITYTLPAQSVVSISIVDQLGRAVWVPVTGASQGAGTYSINFDGSAFPSGEYWCKLSMDSETKLAKIIIGR